MQSLGQYTLSGDQDQMTAEVTMLLDLEIHHQVDGLTAEAVEAAHAKDVEIHAK